jgi:MFS family permease
VVFTDLPSLAVVQAVSGLAWGTVDFASYQLLLSSARAECRVEFLSIASTMGSGGQLVGGLAGGYLRGAPELSYHALFMLSAVGRGLAMTWLVSELPSRLRRDLPQLFLRVISVRPENGTVQRPIVADAADRTPDANDDSGHDTPE